MKAVTASSDFEEQPKDAMLVSFKDNNLCLLEYYQP